MAGTVRVVVDVSVTMPVAVLMDVTTSVASVVVTIDVTVLSPS